MFSIVTNTLNILKMNHHCSDFACPFASNFQLSLIICITLPCVNFFLLSCSTPMYPCYLRLFHQLIVQTHLFCAQMWHFAVSDWGWQELQFLFSRPGWSKTSSNLQSVILPLLPKVLLNGTVLLVLGVVKQKASLLWKHNFRLKQLLKFSLGGNRIENWFRTVHEFQNSTVRMFQGSVYLLRNFISWNSVL